MVELASNTGEDLGLRRELERVRKENDHLRATCDELRFENADLRRENEHLVGKRRELQAAVDAHVARAQRTALFGPLELTAGTCVGPRRGRSS